jgi:hypothetical protein
MPSLSSSIFILKSTYLLSSIVMSTSVSILLSSVGIVKSIVSSISYEEPSN